MADTLTPSISVIDQHPNSLGQFAAKRLFQRVNTPNKRLRRHTVLPVSLVPGNRVECHQPSTPDCILNLTLSIAPPPENSSRMVEISGWSRCNGLRSCLSAMPSLRLGLGRQPQSAQPRQAVVRRPANSLRPEPECSSSNHVAVVRLVQHGSWRSGAADTTSRPA